MHYLIYGYEDEPVPKSYKCKEYSPVDPTWTTDAWPDVFWSHIFCGQICRGGDAQGFHSLTTDSDAFNCVRVHLSECQDLPDGNEKCDYGSVEIYNDISGRYVPKKSETYLFNENMKVNTLINHLRDIYNACAPPTSYDYLCALGCNYLGFSRQFDIKMKLVPRGGIIHGILTAFPAPSGSRDCNPGPGIFTCSGQCRNLQL